MNKKKGILISRKYYSGTNSSWTDISKFPQVASTLINLVAVRSCGEGPTKDSESNSSGDMVLDERGRSCRILME
jgi:hypothetical protein